MSAPHIHLLLNHFPVIGMLIVIALLGVAALRRSSELAKVSLGLLVVLAATAIAVFLTGEPAEEAIENLPGFSESITERHEEFALFATIALGAVGTLALGVLVFLRKRAVPRWLTMMSFALSLVVGGMMTYTAMLGGQVRHTEVRATTINHFERLTTTAAVGRQENPH
jgi:uncharacterized membrane protein